jgi:hypothetical protein
MMESTLETLMIEHDIFAFHKRNAKCMQKMQHIIREMQDHFDLVG